MMVKVGMSSDKKEIGRLKKFCTRVLHLPLIVRNWLSPLILLILRILLSNKHYYYGALFNTTSWGVLFFKNLLYPGRILEKIRYGQFLNSFPIPKKSTYLFTGQEVAEETKAKLLAEEFREFGIVKIPLDLDEAIKHWGNKYQFFANKLDKDFNLNSLRDWDNNLFQFICDPLLLRVYSLIFKSDPYLRYSPAVADFNPTLSTSEIRKHLKSNSGFTSYFANYFECDAPNMLTLQLLLSDISPKGTHLKFAKKSHSYHHVSISSFDYFYSDEYVYDHFEVLDLIDKKGSLYLFHNNGLHRTEAVPGSKRTIMHLNITAGNAILKQHAPLNQDEIPTNFSDHQKNFLRLLFN
ncbi:hypothetical protein MYX82_00865 [Acidobacteria bacterium AH-259-D05]|nr:hypothetical protein [Acidobacteria bacterium AH-259-D05]